MPMGATHANGFGLLLFLLFMAGISAPAILLYQEIQQTERTHSRMEARGKNLLKWLELTHRYSQTNQKSLLNTWGDDHTVAISRQRLQTTGNAPNWLQDTHPQDQITLGITDDGNGIPMAFAHFRSGAISFAQDPRSFFTKIVDGATQDSNEQPVLVGVSGNILTTDRKAAIETILGTALEDGDIIITADKHLPYDTQVLYRIVQPGHPELSRLKTDIKLGGNDLTTDNISSASSEQSGDTTAATLKAETDLTTDRISGANGASFNDAILNSLSSSQLTTAELNTGRLSSNSLSASSLDGVSANIETTLETGTISTLEALANEATISTIRAEVIHKGAYPELTATHETIETKSLYGPRMTINGDLNVRRCTGC